MSISLISLVATNSVYLLESRIPPGTQRSRSFNRAATMWTATSSEARLTLCPGGREGGREGGRKRGREGGRQREREGKREGREGENIIKITKLYYYTRICACTFM